MQGHAGGSEGMRMSALHRDAAQPIEPPHMETAALPADGHPLQLHRPLALGHQTQSPPRQEVLQIF